MTDVFSRKKRSWIMSRVKGRDTGPELLVRSQIHRMGYRFRVCCRDLPGYPDIVLVRHRKVVFVNGCFWHGHPDCPRATKPSSNKQFWSMKLHANRRRNEKHVTDLRHLGWKVLVVWECETRKPELLMRILRRFLG
ncbi:MAG: DNA mismatch endonuclease Vsr [Verrucomicrobia bacterium]|nr:DNA mismatch endonuclease Vsr [Verrucomicrobiota bacterium]